MKFCVQANKCGTRRFLFLGGAIAIGHRQADLIASAQQLASSVVMSSGKCNALYTKGRYIMKRA